MLFAATAKNSFRTAQKSARNDSLGRVARSVDRMKVAIVHYWLVTMRGGEKVVEELCRMYPQADIFTLVCDHEKLSPLLRSKKIVTSFLQRIPGARRHYQKMLPLMPFALEAFDLQAYDLVISSESGPAKAIVAPNRVSPNKPDSQNNASVGLASSISTTVKSLHGTAATCSRQVTRYQMATPMLRPRLAPSAPATFTDAWTVRLSRIVSSKPMLIHCTGAVGCSQG